MGDGRSPSDSVVETTHIVLPPDTNVHGTAFGGKIMQWMDIAAGIAAGRHCGGPVVTAAVDELDFAQPIRMGDVVVVQATVNYAGRTSLEVGVRVVREDVATHRRDHCLTGYFTFVAVDDAGRPMPVPKVVPTGDTELRRYEEAVARRERRVAARRRRQESREAGTPPA